MIRPTHLGAIALAVTLVCKAPSVSAEEPQPSPCDEDAMIVFDASDSMAGNVGKALTKFRRVGLITYGPGPYNQCLPLLRTVVQHGSIKLSDLDYPA
jgi:Ca-activated chloride channel family protein